MIRTALLCLLLIAALSACQGPPPTQVFIVVTATPETSATPEATAAAQTVSTNTPLPPTITPSPAPTATPNVFPTPVMTQIQVAEQVFERGRMLWIEPQRKIWVMADSSTGSGSWIVYDDTFRDGEPENDPTLSPPEGMYQPQRGFGKVWRDNPTVREQLGWALTPEFGYVSPYEYHAGGQVNAQNQYQRGPGYHLLSSLYGNERFRFNETDGTWQKISG
jgi:hypothetical protein